MRGDLIHLSSAPHPFRPDAEVVPVAEGMSISQMLEVAQPDPMLARHAVAFIGGYRIDARYWHCTYPKAGALVEIRVLPAGGGGGGGKDPLRTILSLAVLVASVAIPGLQAFAGLNAFQQGLFQTGIAVVGNLAVNALVPVEQPDGPGKEEEIFAIEGLRNRARPFETVPQILGRRRIAPDYGTRPFTEIVGQDQYLRVVFVWGIGPLHIDESSLRIGETPITDFEGVEIEHRAGYDTDDPITLYPGTVFQDDLQIKLGAIEEGLDVSTGAQVRAAIAEADELGIDITFPSGLIGVGRNSGDRFGQEVKVKVQYRKVGDTAWLTPSFNAKTFPDSWVSGDIVTITGKRQGVVRHGMTWAVPTRGDYEVRLEYLTSDPGQGNNTRDTFWTALRAITDEDPITPRVPVAKTAVRIKATDQLNGTLDEFNGVVTTLGADWDGAAWVDDQQITNSASLFRHVLQGKGNAKPIADARMSLPVLEDFHEFNVDKGFACNLVVRNSRSVWETLSQVAACGRASPGYFNGGWGVAIDRPQPVPVSHVTPRNSAGFSAEKAMIELPHAFRIPFIDERENWRQDEIRVYRTGFDAGSATVFEELRIPGVTDPNQAALLGRYRMAQGIHQPETWTFRQGTEFLTYKRGDRVKITHDVLLVGLVSGRVKEAITDGSDNVTGVVLDELLEMDAGTEYGISIRTLDDASVVRKVTSSGVEVQGGRNVTTLNAPIAPVGGLPAVRRGDLFGFGVFGKETDDAQVISIRPRSDSEAEITAVPYREVIYSGDDEPIPPFETNLTPLPAIPTPFVRNVISDERVIALGSGGSLRIRVAFEVDPVSESSRLAGATLDIQERASGTGEPYVNSTIEEKTEGRVIVGNAREGETIDYRLRWVPQGGRLPGPWVTVANHRVVGRSTPPKTLQGLTLSAAGGLAYLRWQRPDEIDVRFGGDVRFRHSPLTTGATWGASNSIGDLAQASGQLAVLPLKPGTYLARVIDQSGRVSTNTARATTKQATVLDFVLTDTLDEATTFTGTKADLLVDAGTLELTDPAVSQAGVYDFATGFDFGAVVKKRLTSRIALVSFNVFDTIAQRTDLISTWSSIVGDIPDGGDTVVQVRHTDDPAAVEEVITNGTFDTDLNGWTAETNWSWDAAGKAKLDTMSSQNSKLDQVFGARDAQKNYSFTIDVSTGNGLFVLTLDSFGENSSLTLSNQGGSGTFTGTIPAGYDTILFANFSSSQLTCTLDDVSVLADAVVWTDWNRLDSAEFEARAFEFRALVSVVGSDINVSISELGIDADNL